ncbi:PREDICTED: protein CURVATURE THYLAKOID 1D, chloroplastic-like isoform X1 [Ipomoea nil]|uniref:protein CURVATURE THYLAKOID 1D, chloroplastic-like isoform X1 n=1 Tax=Ipomoea nil TaxID=35883 RepID=UPI000900A279|nr:PREDICTED: protein CURVATURE THYLAKOID 1D, chloroplastic-like isoform X1 [Ipomoea nil]
MALCRGVAMSNLPNPTPFAAAPNAHTRLPSKTSLPLKKPSISGFIPVTGVPYYSNLTITFASSGETSSFTQNTVYEPVQTETPKQEEKYDTASYNEASNDDDSSLDFQAQLSKIFAQVGIEFDPENSSSIYLYGGGAILAVWLTSALIGAIDSIPLLPKLLELVGLAYTVWFTIRYLLFKKSREEIAAKIKDIKQEVLG